MFETVFATRDCNFVQINFESVPLLFIAFVRQSLYPTSTCLDYWPNPIWHLSWWEHNWTAQRQFVKEQLFQVCCWGLIIQESTWRRGHASTQPGNALLSLIRRYLVSLITTTPTFTTCHTTFVHGDPPVRQFTSHKDADAVKPQGFCATCTVLCWKSPFMQHLTCTPAMCYGNQHIYKSPVSIYIIDAPMDTSAITLDTTSA